jgi:uncharacterized protein (TIGR00255 family)
MTRSMTGFGAAGGTVGSAHVSVELRSVNHRFFNVSIRLPNELSRFEGEVRETLRSRVARGHLSLTARLDRPNGDLPAINTERFGHFVALLRELQERHRLESNLDIGTILRLPDVMSSTGAENEGTAAEMVAIVDAAAIALQQARSAEGSRLVTYLEERLVIVLQRLDRIAQRAPVRIVEHRDRLRLAVRELTEGVGVDDQRIAQEISILAERLDIQEELSRFQSHITAFTETLSGKSGEPIGKRLGFLLQEMLREANTTGSKANDAEMLADVVVIKEELERIREQVENLE